MASQVEGSADSAGPALIRGHCCEGFEAVRSALARCFCELGETGAAVAVYHRGVLVCDLWAGVAAAAEGLPEGGGKAWREETLVMPYSVSKPMAALCCLLLVDRGLLDVERPVAEYWPEFGAAGKGSCTVRQLLEHQAGIPFVPEGCSLEELLDVPSLCARLAAEPPLYEPGSVTAEHAIIYGHLCDALVRRLAGESLGSFFKREVAEKLGVDLHFGVPEDRLADCADLSPWPQQTIDELKGLTPVSEKALFQPDALCQRSVVNSRQWRQAEVPAVNLHGTARGIAKVYAVLANGGELDGVQLLQPSSIALLRTPGAWQKDGVFGFESSWVLGFQCKPWRGTQMSTFGLGGIGGSSAFGSADADLQLGFAYVTRQMGDWQRAEMVEEAVLQAILQLNLQA